MNRTFGDDVEHFIQGISSLSATLPLVKSVLRVTRDKTRQDLEKFIKTKAEIVKEDAGKRHQIFTVDAEHGAEFEKIRTDYQAAMIAARVIPRSFIVALVSQFDVHIGHLVRTMFYVNPEKLNASQKNLTFAELLTFESIDGAREYIIEKEIESLLRESHTAQFKWLEGQLGITLRKDLPIWPDFIEVTERRNLFVHTDGVISSQYIAVCKEHSVPLPADAKAGKTLFVSRDYFQCAYRCIFEIGVQLAHVMWRKLLPSERPIADDNLIKIGYDLIVGEDYDLAINVLEFATDTLKTHASEDARLRLTVNLAQAHKWRGAPDKCLSILDKIDWSALETKFKLANAVLRDDFDVAATLMRRIGDSGEISKPDYRDWPLFKVFRTTGQFRKAHKEIFGEELQPSQQELVSDEGGSAELRSSES